MNIKLVSIDFKAQFGFLKKPDTNEGIYFTYNIIHKPALLGILGAIVGLEGYYQAYVKNKSFPQYWEKFESIKIAIEPLNSDKGTYNKTIVKYNNSVGYANLDGGTLIITEQILIAPNFRIYIKLNLENEIEKQLYENLKNDISEFIPYFGKNDFQLWWENFFETENFTENFKPTEKFIIDSIFVKTSSDTLKENIPIGFDIELDLTKNGFGKEFAYFERLPIGFNQITGNYELANFSYSNYKLKPTFDIDGLCKINSLNKIIQLF